MAFVQGAHNSVSASSASLTATFGAGVTSGNTVWGIVAWNATSGAPTSVTVGGVSAAILDTVNDVANAASATTFILGNVSGAPTSVVANFSPNQAFITLIAIEESGCLAASNPVDVHVGHLQTSPGTGANIINSGNVTTTAANGIIVGAYCDSVGTSVGTAGTSPLAFTLRTTDTAAGEPVATEDGVVLVTPGTAASTFGQSVNDTALSFVIAIKPTAAATSLPPGQQSFATPQPDRDTSSFPPQLRSWAAPDRLILIGQDKLPPGAQSFQRQPDPQNSFAQWRTWAQSRNPNLSGLDQLPPGRQTNYLPFGATWRPESPQQNLANTLLTPLAPPPPGKQLYARPLDLFDPFSQWRAWTWFSRNLLGQDQFPPGTQTNYLARGNVWQPESPQQNLSISTLQPLPPGGRIYDRLQLPPSALEFGHPANLALLIGPSLPPGQQLYALWSQLLDSFAQWRSWSSFNPNLRPAPPRPPGSQLYSLPPFGPPPVVPSGALFNINLFPPPFIPPPPTFPATYYLLEDLYINEHYLPAGTVQSTQDLGGVLPLNWVPNPNVDPVDTGAIAAYTAVGYQPRGLMRQQYSSIPVLPPNYVWQMINNEWVLVKVANFPRVP
jgi:hypothetical protein